MTDHEAQTKAFFEGAAAASSKVLSQANPYKEGALFDELQLADYWYQGHAHARQRAATKISRARRKSAAHYAY